MAIDPITLALGGASLLSGFLGADKAADAAEKGAANAIAEQRRQFDTVLGLQMPAIQTGNVARSQLASILGLQTAGTTGYNPINPLQGFNIAGGGGRTASTGGAIAGLALGGLTGGLLGGSLGGRVETKNRPIAQSDLQRLLDTVKANPTAYDEQGEIQALISRNRPGAQAQIANALVQNKLGYFADPQPAAAGQPVSGDQVQQMIANYPGFQFAVDQARRASTAQASATGSGPISGNVLTALQTDIAGRVAMPAFNDYLNRLAGLSGGGQVASGTASSAAQNTGANVSNLLQSQGDSRASGILGQTGAILGGLGGLGEILGRRGTNPVGGYDFNRTFPT
jgi:hypothetical protein